MAEHKNGGSLDRREWVAEVNGYSLDRREWVAAVEVVFILYRRKWEAEYTWWAVVSTHQTSGKRGEHFLKRGLIG